MISYSQLLNHAVLMLDHEVLTMLGHDVLWLIVFGLILVDFHCLCYIARLCHVAVSVRAFCVLYMIAAPAHSWYDSLVVHAVG